MRTAVAVAGLLVAATLAIAVADEPALLRHLYLLPTGWAALRFGLAAGVSTAVIAIALDAPFVLPHIEAYGFDGRAAEELIAAALLVVVGALAGLLSDRGRRRNARYRTALALQRAFSAGHPLPEALGLANVALGRYVGGPVEVIVRLGDSYVGQGGRCVLSPDSIGARAAARGDAWYVADAPPRRPGRPWRLIVHPLLASGHVVGLLAAARQGDLPPEERSALQTLGVVIALALENARLGDELETRVEAATRHLADLDRAKSEFVATASHELRTPLTALLGFSELLLTRALPEEQARRYLGVIHREAERLTRIVDDLLDLSRIERGQRSELRPTAVDVVAALETNAEIFRAQGSGHVVRVTVAPSVAPALADPDSLDRILKNLLSNAVKYSPAGSEIRLTATSGEEGVAITVEDDGPGIPDESLPHVFEAYYRVPGRARAIRGLGLGLALVKSLVDAHSGAVRAERAPHGGSRFTVTLPIADAAALP